VVDEIRRQFGHAATDRQHAYLSEEEIEALANNDVLLKLCRQWIQLGVFREADECLHRVLYLAALVKREFESVYHEPKLENTPENRTRVKARNSAPLVSYDMRKMSGAHTQTTLDAVILDNAIRTKSVMRKCMIYAIEETLNVYANSVYIGEDVSHGGYYLITDGLAAKYPLRLRDFPPDETAIFGIGAGYAHAGFVPIVEVPYAKYLDCGADMFFETCIYHWLSAGQQACGVLYRLQGFGNGLFGGNFHTHNSLYLVPGLDVVCFANGYDYVNGWRYCMQQVENGRCVMSVDCTQLLNQRHLYDGEKDGALLTNIPSYAEYLTFNDFMIYTSERQKFIVYDAEESCEHRMVSPELGYIEMRAMHDVMHAGGDIGGGGGDGIRVAIVTYGLGVNAARQAQHELMTVVKDDVNNIANVMVIDTPYLSDIPAQLKYFLQNYGSRIDCLVFADMCKEGQNPLNGSIAKLQNQNILQRFCWASCAAQFTYNPLGKDLTFLSKNDVIECVQRVVKQYHQGDRVSK